MTLTDELASLVKLSRSAKNFAKIQEFIGGLSEHKDGAGEVLDAISDMQDHLDNIQAALDQCPDDNPLTENWIADLWDAVTNFRAVLPEYSGDVSELIAELESAAEEYEGSIGDRDYSADDRESMWGEIISALENLHSALTPAGSAK